MDGRSTSVRVVAGLSDGGKPIPRGPIWTFLGLAGHDNRMSDGRSGTTGDDKGRAPIRVWRAALDRPESETAALAALLAPDERARADRFRFERDRRRFAVGRGLLRTLLARTLATAPEEIVFCYGTRGKPALARADGTDLEFNLSHSNGLALLATSWGRAVGIDLEYEGKSVDFLGIADRYFTSQELGQIRNQPEEAGRRRAFFRGWARKEAFLKARGDGLWVGLDQFEVSIDADLPPRVVWTAWDPDEAGRWSVHALDVAPDFASALVVEGAVAGPIEVETF
jgi:4'-phosphopantetheinyl transferase